MLFARARSVEAGDTPSALNCLTEKLKPLERYAAAAGEFAALCYALTCRSVHEVEALR